MKHRMKLIGQSCPNVNKVLLLASYKNIELERICTTFDGIKDGIPLHGNDQKKVELSTLNPLNRLPVLEYKPGHYLYESIVICRFLDELDPKNSLFGHTQNERLAIETYMRAIEIDYLHSSLWWMRRFRHIPEIYKITLDKYESIANFLNSKLEKDGYLATKNFSMADIMLFITVEYETYLNIIDATVYRKKYKALYQYYDQLYKDQSLHKYDLWYLY